MQSSTSDRKEDRIQNPKQMSVSCDIGILNLPNEILNEILIFCDVTDFCRLSQVCHKLYEVIQSDYLWSQKWSELVKKSGLFFNSYSDIPPKCDGKHTECYHARCKRLWLVCWGLSKEDRNLPICIHCKNKTCTRQGLDNLERKIAIDIGSKTTWLVSSTFSLQRHPSVLVTSPLSQCCTLHSQHCARILQFQRPRVCLLCTPQNYSTSEEELMSDCNASTANGSLQKCALSNKSEINSENCYPVFHTDFNFTQSCPLWSDLRYSYQMRFPTSEIISPIDSLTGNGEFYHLEHYLCHIFDQFQIRKELRKPNVTLVFCVPFNINSCVQKKLMEFVFEVAQASSVCFVNKAFCIASLIGLETCLVVDSGASNTVVSLIVNNEVQFQRVQHCPIGGVVIANYLAEAIRINGLMNDVSISSLDTSRVKLSCFLPYNIAVQEIRRTAVKQNVFVRSTSPFPHGIPTLKKLELGSELYLAPEIMYAAMNLPHMIKEVLNGLDENLVKEALSHLLLTGSNTELNGFTTRLIRDLCMLIPEYAHIINVRDCAGSRSWDAVIGATHLTLPNSSFSNLKSSGKMPSSLLLVTREEYILHGTNIFE